MQAKWTGQSSDNLWILAGFSDDEGYSDKCIPTHDAPLTIRNLVNYKGFKRKLNNSELLTYFCYNLTLQLIVF